MVTFIFFWGGGVRSNHKHAWLFFMFFFVCFLGVFFFRGVCI